MRTSIIKKGYFGILLLILIPVSCQTVGTRFDYQKDIEIGYSDRAKIIATYGEPKAKGTTTRNGFTSDQFHYFVKDIWDEQYKELLIEFTGEKVNGFYYQANWINQESDFDVEKHKKIVIGETTKESVEELVGAPSGKISIPSNFFSPEFVKSPVEKGAKSCFRYGYAGKQGLGYTATHVQKILIVFFDAGGKVIDLYVSNVNGKSP